jgi:hypothetical protein
LVLALGVASLANAVHADEIVDQINEAIKMYEAGDYAGAVSELEFAATQIRQLQAGEISNALPQPLPGWKAEDIETSAMSGAMMGGGVTAGREYHKDDASIEIQIIGQAPMLQAVAMMFQNPMIMSSSGKKLTKIKGYKAAVEYKEGERSGEIQLIVQSSVLVTVSGHGVSEEDLKTYAEAIDYKLIEKLAAGG